MPVNTRELIEAVSVVADERNMRVTMNQSAKGAMITAATTFVGGILGGPVGLAVGATVGGVSCAYKFRGTFKPLSEILRNDLTEADRARLQNHIVNAVREVHPTDVALLIPLIMGDASVQAAVFRTVSTFITQEMGLRMID